MKRRMTADERDRAIVAKAGPWTVADSAGDTPTLEPYALAMVEYRDDDEGLANTVTPSLLALCRIANRIWREKRRDEERP